MNVTPLGREFVHDGWDSYSLVSLGPQELREAQIDGGLLIADVSGPSALAGVQAGDVLLAINGTPAKSIDQVRAVVAKADKSVALLIQREGNKIFVPVLFGEDGVVQKRFDADAWHRGWRIVLEVEAGRALLNNQFLKDLFQASMMVEIDYCVIAVRNLYRSNNDFRSISTFLETLYTSSRLQLPLKGVLIIGY